MDAGSVIIALIIGVPIVLGVVFLISGYLTSKLSDNNEKPNNVVFVVIFIIILVALIFGSNTIDGIHEFRP